MEAFMGSSTSQPPLRLRSCAIGFQNHIALVRGMELRVARVMIGPSACCTLLHRCCRKGLFEGHHVICVFRVHVFHVMVSHVGCIFPNPGFMRGLIVS